MAIGDNYPVLMGFDKAAPDGVATLDASGNVPFEQLGNVVRPNLLDNWYFANPVNQRGQTEYAGAGYTIDRWRTTGAGMVVLVEDDGITVKNTGTAVGYFSQVKEPMEVGGYAASLNVLSVSGAVDAILRNHDTWDYQGTLTISGVGVSRSVLTVKDAWKSYRQWFEIRLAAGASVKLKAAKLELGSTQTLAHQETVVVDGEEKLVWVLNEIPDYGEELRKCQRYLYPLPSKNNDFSFLVGMTGSSQNTYATKRILMRKDGNPAFYPSTPKFVAKFVNQSTMFEHAQMMQDGSYIKFTLGSPGSTIPTQSCCSIYVENDGVDYFINKEL